MAFVETDLGEVVRVIRPDGLTGGKVLLSFLTISAAGCRKSNSADESIVTWINDFKEKSEIDFCSIVERLNHAYYSGNWDYQENEYDFFVHRSPGSELSELDFQSAVKAVREMWTDVHTLINNVRVLVSEFRKGYLKETDWYVEDDTIGDFEGLLNALILVKERNAKAVRIRIE